MQSIRREISPSASAVFFPWARRRNGDYSRNIVCWFVGFDRQSEVERGHAGQYPSWSVLALGGRAHAELSGKRVSSSALMMLLGENEGSPSPEHTRRYSYSDGPRVVGVFFFFFLLAGGPIFVRTLFVVFLVLGQERRFVGWFRRFGRSGGNADSSKLTLFSILTGEPELLGEKSCLFYL